MSREGGGGSEKTESSKKSGASDFRRERRRHEGSAATQPPGTSAQGPGTSQGVSTAEAEFASGRVAATGAEVQLSAAHNQPPSPSVAAAASLQGGATVAPESTTTPGDPSSVRPVIAVSASKGPAAFFNLARKFLVTEETCDLSALEGAIVSAVDAAHLLERSKLATITRIQTSYIAVEPKRKRQQTGAAEVAVTAEGASGVGTEPRAHGITSMGAAHAGLPSAPMYTPSRGSAVGLAQQQQHYPQPPPSRRKSSQRAKGVPLRRARIVITVRRTEDYRRWLEENPHHQALIASGEGDIEGEEGGEEHEGEEGSGGGPGSASTEGRFRSRDAGRRHPPKSK